MFKTFGHLKIENCLKIENLKLKIILVKYI